MKKKEQDSNIQTCELYVEGMHCAACEILIEKKLKKVDGVTYVDAKLNDNKVIIKGDLQKSPDELAQEFTQIVKKDGYTIHAQKKVNKKRNIEDFIYALPIALGIILIFIILQKLGLLKSDISERNYPAIFFLGFIASLSSCMAVTGGLVLSISANYAKELGEKSRIKAQIIFHISRLLGFFLLGGLIGFLGQELSIVKITAFLLSIFGAFIYSALVNINNHKVKLGSTILSGIIIFILSIGLNEIWAQFALSILTGVVMLILGLNLLELFQFTRKLQLRLPKSFSHSVLAAENINSRFAPLLLGIATFFLPCGFTQSVQVYALGTKSALTGSLTMLAFALGTLPILALISFASVNFSKSIASSGRFFKVAGLVVIFFAIINMLGAFTTVNLLPQIFSFK